MDPPRLSPTAPRLAPRAHTRTPSRSPTRTRITDDILSDLSPATTLEAFTNPSGRLKASIEAATPSERAFGIKATLASKKIQEWVDELSQWPWPASGGSAGFEIPAAKRRKLSTNGDKEHTSQRNGSHDEGPEYIGSLLTQEVVRYETRIEEITEDMDDLNVEEIKSQVLDTHFSSKSRPSSAASSAPMPNLLSYTRMDDFTAIVTATVLHALPNLSRLMRLMDVWSVRLSVLRKVPPLLLALDDAEVALKSGWKALDVPGQRVPGANGQESKITEEEVLSRKTFQIMRDVLQNKVTTLGQDLDYMLDTLEGRQDTLPESWLDRMEIIEQDYGEWVVAGDRKVREGEWSRMAKARKEREDALKLKEEEVAEAAIQRASKDAAEAEEAWHRDEASRQAAEAEKRKSKVAEAADAIRARDSSLGASEPEESSDDPSHFNGMSKTLAAAGAAVGLAADHLLTRSQNQSRSDTSNIPDTEGPLSPVMKLAIFDGNNSEANESNVAPQPASKPKRPVDEHGQFAAQEIEGNGGGIAEAKVVSSAMHTEETPSTPRTPLSSGLHTNLALGSPSNHPTDGRSPESDSPRTPVNVPRFGHTFANMLRRSSSPQASSESRPTSSGSAPKTPISDFNRFRDPAPDSSNPEPSPPTPARSPLRNKKPKELAPPQTPTKQPIDDEWIIVDSTEDRDIPQASNSDSQSEEDDKHSDLDEHLATKGHSRNPFQLSGYLTSEPTPVLLQAEPASYFRPMLSPIRSVRSLGGSSSGEPTTPTKSPLTVSAPMLVGEVQPSSSELRTPPKSPTARGESEDSDLYVDSEIVIPELHSIERPTETSELDGAQESVLCDCGIPDSVPILARRESITRINSPIRRIVVSRRASTSSDTSTIITGLARDTATSSPYAASSPISDKGQMDLFPVIDEQSPSAGRVGLRNNPLHDYSPPESPPPIPLMSKRRSLQRPKTPQYSHLEPTDVPPTPTVEAPLLENVDVSEVPILSSPKKSSTEQSTDDQIQQQISSILETIPARIRLTSEPDTEPIRTDTIQPKKTRRSITPSFRSHSSLSMQSRAPTPSFTLAPAYSKGPSRPRPSSSNPEIKLYHLSRSTGEAPIKLFVRLVGENGERVMVRVGGGWADLGEYLKEYASHHGRRNVGGENDKVEIQDLPPRIVSTGSTNSVTTLRGNGNGNGNGNGRSSPVSRPASAFDRPMSSLNIRKTRKSVGESESSFRASDPRSPSTPLPSSSSFMTRKPPPANTAAVETPPSATSTASRSSSQLSWTEDDSSLGLAGPKSKKTIISERDQEWVESMKEKVRLASAEKERKVREGGVKEGDRKASFGEMEKVGGTKRLFRKG